jgi:hypothetical protein
MRSDTLDEIESTNETLREQKAHKQLLKRIYYDDED